MPRTEHTDNVFSGFVWSFLSGCFKGIQQCRHNNFALPLYTSIYDFTIPFYGKVETFGLMHSSQRNTWYSLALGHASINLSINHFLLLLCSGATHLITLLPIVEPRSNRTWFMESEPDLESCERFWPCLQKLIWIWIEHGCCPDPTPPLFMMTPFNTPLPYPHWWACF